MLKRTIIHRNLDGRSMAPLHRHFKVVRLKNKIGRCKGPFDMHVNVLFHPKECDDPILCKVQI